MGRNVLRDENMPPLNLDDEYIPLQDDADALPGEQEGLGKAWLQLGRSTNTTLSARPRSKIKFKKLNITPIMAKENIKGATTA